MVVVHLMVIIPPSNTLDKVGEMTKLVGLIANIGVAGTTERETNAALIRF